MVEIADQSSRKKINAQEAKKQARRLSLESTLRTILGRKALWDELEECHIFGQTVDFDSHARMCFAEGQRSRGLILLADILALDPASFIAMMRENSRVEIKETTDGGSADDTSSD